LRLNKQGDTLWTRTYGDLGGQRPAALVRTSDGGYLVAGRMESNHTWGWAVKTDSTGGIVWIRQMGWGYLIDEFNAVIETSDGGYLVAGHCHPGTSDCNGWLVKLAINGDTVWTRTVANGWFEDVRETPDGGYIFCGGSPSSESHLWLYRTDAHGDAMWSRTYSYVSFGSSVRLTDDGGFVASGMTHAGHLGLLRMDADGDTLWCQDLGGSTSAWTGVTQLPNGDFVEIGSDAAAPWAHLDLARTYGNGVSTFMTRDSVYASAIETTMDGGYVLAGSRTRNETGDFDLWVAKIAPDPVIPSSSPKVIAPPSSFGLSAYPNPFNPTTRISFAMPEAGNATLEIFDMLGQWEATLQNGFMSAGEHVAVLDGWKLSAGIHFARLSTTHRQATIKLLLVK
jgi:hypothetical protein